MKTQKIALELPSNLGFSEDELKFLLVIKLFELGKISRGKASEILGVSLADFLESLSKFNIPVINYGLEDLDQEINFIKHATS